MDIIKRPMLFAAIFCSIISAVSLYIPFLAFLLSAVAITVFIFGIINKKYKYITVLLLLILFTVSLTFEFIGIAKIKSYDGENLNGSFVVTEDIVDHGEYNSLILKEKDCNILPNNTKLLAFDYKKTSLKKGDIVYASINLSAVDKIDKYRFSNYGDGIYATANIKSVSKTPNTSWLYKTTGKICNYINKKITSIFTGDKAGLLIAVTTGDKTLLSDEFLANVKTTGISHVIVVSGMHLAIIMNAIYWCIDRLFYNKYIRCALSIMVVIIIYSVCGFTMSITRAGAMFIIAGLAPIFNRENDSLSSILTAVAVVLVATPFAIVNVSFLLSVLSTLAIIWIVPFYYNAIIKRFNIASKFLKTIVASVLCSIFAVVFTLPVTIKIFGYISIVSPITNLIINLPVTIALVLNILAVIVSIVPILNVISLALFYMAGLCSDLTVLVVNSIARFPITVAVLPKIAFWWSIFLIITIIGYMYYYEFKRERSGLNANSIRG